MPRLPLSQLVGLAATASLAALPLPAQTVVNMLVSKTAYVTQTDNATISAPSLFEFNATVSGLGQPGDNLSGLSGGDTPEVTSKPGGSGPIGPLVYNSGFDEWNLGGSFGTSMALNMAYGNGNYDLKVKGVTQTIFLGPTGAPPPLDGNGIPLDAPPWFPLASLTPGATISGGVLTWNVAQPLTITADGNATFGPTLSNSIDYRSISIWGPGLERDDRTFGGSSVGLTIDPFSMTAGSTYYIEMTYGNISGGTDLTEIASGALAGVFYGGGQLQTTTFTISAIPEPSTYAALAGTAMLGLAFWRRRRRALE